MRPHYDCYYGVCLVSQTREEVENKLLKLKPRFNDTGILEVGAKTTFNGLFHESHEYVGAKQRIYGYDLFFLLGDTDNLFGKEYTYKVITLLDGSGLWIHESAPGLWQIYEYTPNRWQAFENIYAND